MEKWELFDQLVAQVCRITGATVLGGGLVDKNGDAMLYHDCVSVCYDDFNVTDTSGARITGITLWGDCCLELQIADINSTEIDESLNWSEFDINVLKNALGVITNIKNN